MPAETDKKTPTLEEIIASAKASAPVTSEGNEPVPEANAFDPVVQLPEEPKPEEPKPVEDVIPAEHAHLSQVERTKLALEQSTGRAVIERHAAARAARTEQ